MFKILVVDDEKSTRDFLECYINTNFDEFDVIKTLNNGKDAIMFLSENDVDIVICDIMMPKIDGLELAKYINENHNRIKVILMSAYNEFEYARKAISYNVYYYLTKIIDVNELYDVLLRIKSSSENIQNRSNNTDNDDDNIYWERERLFLDMTLKAENSYTIKKRINEMFKNLDINCLTIEAYDVKIENIDEILKKWSYGIDTFEMAIMQLLDNIEDNIYIFYARLTKKQFTIIALFDKNRKITASQMIEEWRKNILENFRINTDFKFITSNSFEEFFEENPNDFTGRDEYENIDLPKQERVAKAEKYIHENYMKNIGRDDVADNIGLNKIYLNRLFTECKGKSVSEFILELRMEKAIELICADEKLINIPELIGFNSYRHFRRVFLNYTGYTPNEYKQNILKQGYKP